MSQYRLTIDSYTSDSTDMPRLYSFLATDGKLACNMALNATISKNGEALNDKGRIIKTQNLTNVKYRMDFNTRINTHVLFMHKVHTHFYTTL